MVVTERNVCVLYRFCVSLPCLGVADAASRRFWGDGETDPERPQHLHHRANAGVALAGQRLVQAGPAQVGFVGDGGHAHSARHGADRLDEKFRVVFFERGFQVFEPGFGIVQKLGTVPRGIRFFFHVVSLECARHALRAVDVLLLARLIATTQQENHGLVLDRVINAIALGHVDPQLADPLAHAPVVAKIAVCHPV